MWRRDANARSNSETKVGYKKRPEFYLRVLNLPAINIITANTAEIPPLITITSVFLFCESGR
jgi:hypothetical protein